jgi:hypothetical protein
MKFEVEPPNAGLLMRVDRRRPENTPRKPRLPLETEIHPTSGAISKGDCMKKALSAAATVAGVASLAFAGYVLLVSLPDFRRYVKISTM